LYKNVYYQREKNLIHLWDDVKGYYTFPYQRYAYEPALKGEYLSINGEKLTKIYNFKKDDATLFESDVPETTRVLVDMYPDSDEISEAATVMTFDIECEMESGLPDVKEATNELTAIGLHDNISNDYVVLIMDKTGKMVQKQTDKALVLPFKTEEELCLKFLEIYEGIAPDIITGWNIDYFDIPYLFNRIKRLLGEQHANRLSPIGQSFYSPYRQRFFLAGVSVLDYITLYKNYNFGELPNYRLDTIGKIELGKGKIEYAGNLDELFNTDIDKFIEYNLVDVEIVVELDKKLQFIELCRGICHAGHVPYEDFVYSSKYLEGAMLTYLRRKNLVATNKPADRRERMAAMKEVGAEKFIGAYVKDPIVGKYDWVYDLDLTSLYPSIIMTLNISPEMKFAKVISPEWDATKYIKGDFKDTDIVIRMAADSVEHTLKYENFKRLMDDGNHTISSNGVLYTMPKESVVGKIVSK
jgi:DNA polymerase elongation subunit (family B)